MHQVYILCRYQAPGSFDEFWKEVVQSDKTKARNQQKTRSSGSFQSASGFTDRRSKKFNGKDKSKPNSAKKGDNKDKQMFEKKEERSIDIKVSKKELSDKDKRRPNSAKKGDNKNRQASEKTEENSNDTKTDKYPEEKKTVESEKMETDS